MDMSVNVVIIAALEREMMPLVRKWRVLDENFSAAYRSFLHEGTLVACAGIGAATVSRVAERVLDRYSPGIVVSAGLAGALVPEIRIGQIFTPATIINSGTGTRLETKHGQGVLVTASGIAGPEAKRLLARTFDGQVVDMEAAHVADVARKRGVSFTAIKAISDEYDFPVPEFEPFVDMQGHFLTGKFLAHVALRPSMWSSVRQLARQSGTASRELCHALQNRIQAGFWSKMDAAPASPVPGKEGIRSR